MDVVRITARVGAMHAEPEALRREKAEAAAALGASLGDIIPGESKGTDLTLDNLDELIDTGSNNERSTDHD